jgi:hypothetical protein
MTIQRKTSNVLWALKWYFESKNLALKNASAFRCPLAVEQQMEMRQYYGTYLSCLISATELLLEKEYPHKDQFKHDIEQALVSHAFPIGADNYQYLRELRNAVIHRGLDICSAAHIDGDIPVIVAPSPIPNRTGKQSCHSFGYYLRDVISQCEAVIGPTIADHLQTMGLLNSTVNPSEAMAEMKSAITDSTVMPEWAKPMALADSTISSVDFVKVEETMIEQLVELLRLNAAQRHSLYG